MRRTVLLVLALLAAGCLQQGVAPQGDAGPVGWRSLARDTDSGMTERQTVVLSDEAAWAAAWSLHASSPNPKGAAPQVDFAAERVVVVALGQKGSTCHDVRVEDVTRRDGQVVVSYARFDGESQVCGAALVQPVHFVAIRDREADVTFEERVVRPPEPWPYADDDAEAGEPEPLSTRRLDRGASSGIGEDLRTVVRSQAEWEALWARHGKDGPAPDVSFPNESVVAVVEHGPTGCFGVHVGNVAYDPATQVLQVDVVHERTPEGHACIQALTDAYDFVAIPDRPGDARFVDLEAMGGDGPGSGGEGDAPDAPYRTLDQGASSGIHEAQRLVLESEAAWRAFWTNHTATRIPPPAPPAVDFVEERVFAALAGDRSNTCWALRVERVEEGPENVTVEVVTYEPPRGAMCGFAVTQPHHVVALPASGTPIVVVETTREGPPPND